MLPIILSFDKLKRQAIAIRISYAIACSGIPATICGIEDDCDLIIDVPENQRARLSYIIEDVLIDMGLIVF